MRDFNSFQLLQFRNFWPSKNNGLEVQEHDFCKKKCGFLTKWYSFGAAYCKTLLICIFSLEVLLDKSNPHVY